MNLEWMTLRFILLCYVILLWLEEKKKKKKKRTMDMSFKVFECVQFLAKSWKIFQGGCLGSMLLENAFEKKMKPNLDLVLISNEYLDCKIWSGTLR